MDRRGPVPGAEAEALWRAVVETSDDAIFCCDAGGVIRTWSAAAARLFGRPEEDAVGHPLGVLFPEHLQEDAVALRSRTMAGEGVRRFESEVLRGDGLPLPVSLSACPVGAAGPDQPAALVVVARDITEQRLAQAVLAEVEVRLQESEAVVHVGSWLWDLRTGSVQWSSEFYRIHGVDPLDFAGTLESHLQAVHPGDRDRVHTVMHDAARSGRGLETEYRIVRPDRAVRLLWVWAEPTIGSAGVAVGLRGSGQDVTEHPRGSPRSGASARREG